ncbi:MAG: UDP-N-acetylmuramoyl-L-alanine--D-glutamate ligase [Spirochaetales bacterium]|nr:UDP-N-acetylmuramoyl-L-alanine--D-glutamate ligase [Spirochaetales bacterium]
MKINGKAIEKIRVTIMGLGLHGGGLSSALFFARQKARVTITDLREKSVLKSSLDKLAGFPIRYVLGRHEAADFSDVDLIIKNPGVALDSPFLKIAREHLVPIESDISIFLQLCKNPVIAVTGSKGKSTTASAIHFCLSGRIKDAKLGGNITVSPLTFIEELEDHTPVVLELSSWQLADLKGKPLFKPKISLITNILPDHMNRYKDMNEYVADKKIIFETQNNTDYSIFNYDDAYCDEFARESKAGCLFFSSTELPVKLPGAWLKNQEGYVRINGSTHKILEKNLLVAGTHNRLNLLCAGLALYVFGLDPEFIRSCLSKFQGIEHRLERFHTVKGIDFYNDSASTIPHAVVAAVKSLPQPIILITGGTDKNIDFSPLENIMRIPRQIILLKGTATRKILSLIKKHGVSFCGPFADLTKAVRCAYENARPGMSVLFSPGCASFGMFLNEFDRGKKFKRIVKLL